jgi:hypothetical protein
VVVTIAMEIVDLVVPEPSVSLDDAKRCLALLVAILSNVDPMDAVAFAEFAKERESANSKVVLASPSRLARAS